MRGRDEEDCIDWAGAVCGCVGFQIGIGDLPRVTEEAPDVCSGGCICEVFDGSQNGITGVDPGF